MKDNKQKVSVSGTIGFCDLLGVLFIALKLCGVISWPWKWVLAPIWMPIALYVAVILIVFIIGKWLSRKRP